MKRSRLPEKSIWKRRYLFLEFISYVYFSDEAIEFLFSINTQFKELALKHFKVFLHQNTFRIKDSLTITLGGKLIDGHYNELGFFQEDIWRQKLNIFAPTKADIDTLLFFKENWESS